MAKQYRDPERPEQEYPLTLQDIRFLVKTLLRYPQMLQGACSSGLSSEQFNGPNEIMYQYAIHAAAGLVRVHNSVTREMLEAELRAWIAAGACVGVSEFDMADFFGSPDQPGFLHDVFTPAENVEQRDIIAEKEYGQKLLSKFLKARYITQELSRILDSSSQDSSPRDMEMYLEQFHRRAQSIKYIGTEIDDDDFMPTFGADIPYDPVIAVPTGLPWIDSFIGGFAPGEVVGLLGPTGGGKSNMMICASVRMAQYYAANNIDKLSVYVCYEDGNYRMKPLFWSAATHIPRETFTEEGFNWERLSTSDMPNDADRRLPENQNGAFILGERERYIAAQTWMKTHFKFFDFSHNISTGGRGTGGIAEIVSVVQQICEKRKKQLGFLCIDYSGLMLERNLLSTGKISSGTVDNIYLPLKMLGDTVRYSLAAPYGATVMLAHQIAGADAKQKPFHRHLHHFDVQGCKAFAENLHSCVCINTADPDTGARLINFSKIRYGAPENTKGIILIKREYCSIELVSDFYTVDEFSKKIVPKNETRASTGESAAVRTAGPPRRLIPGDSFSHDIL